MDLRSAEEVFIGDDIIAELSISLEKATCFFCLMTEFFIGDENIWSYVIVKSFLSPLDDCDESGISTDTSSSPVVCGMESNILTEPAFLGLVCELLPGLSLRLRCFLGTVCVDFMNDSEESIICVSRATNSDLVLISFILLGELSAMIEF